MAQGPTVRRLQLGRELRRHREATEISREQAAGRVERDITWIRRAETGKLTPSVAEVEMLLVFYGVDADEIRRVKDIAKEARKRSSTRVPDLIRAYFTFEAEAVEIQQFAIDLVPGLLQTEDYSRAVMTALDPDRGPAETERLVSFRSQRQARVTDDEPLKLWVVMDEGVLGRPVGDPDVMRTQLDRLLALGRRPNVSIRILPKDVGEHAAMGTPFSVLRLEEPGGQVVYLEDLLSADFLDQDMQVRAYVRAFDRIGKAALSEKSSAGVIKRVQGELR